MNCNRCNGLCIKDYVEESGRFFAVGRCVNCGSIVFPEASEKTTPPARLLKNVAGKQPKKRPHDFSKKHFVEKICA